MATPIEIFLFAGRGTCGVTEFTQDQHSIRLRIAAWVAPDVSTGAVFKQAKMTSIDVYNDDVDDLNMPWDIIAIDCRRLEHERWEFVLHCSSIEYGFESEWPELTNP